MPKFLACVRYGNDLGPAKLLEPKATTFFAVADNPLKEIEAAGLKLIEDRQNYQQASFILLNMETGTFTLYG